MEAEHAAKAMTAAEALSEAGALKLQSILGPAKMKKVVIIGGSHSAFSVAWSLLYGSPPNLPVAPAMASSPAKPAGGEASPVAGGGVTFRAKDITILHRSKVRLMFASVEAASQAGYGGFDPDTDVSAQGRVNPFSGLRYDAKKLFQAVKQGLERRVVLERMGATGPPLDKVKQSPQVKLLLDNAVAIVIATGFETHEVPIRDPDGGLVPLLRDARTGQAMVDEQGRLQRADGRPLAALYGAGLGHGQPCKSPLVAGERGESGGRADGVDLYFRSYGHLLLQGILAAGCSGGVPEDGGQKDAPAVITEAREKGGQPPPPQEPHEGEEGQVQEEISPEEPLSPPPEAVDESLPTSPASPSPPASPTEPEVPAVAGLGEIQEMLAALGPPSPSPDPFAAPLMEEVPTEGESSHRPESPGTALGREGEADPCHRVGRLGGLGLSPSGWLGQRVETPSGHVGSIAFVGPALFAPGLWVGVELDEPNGKTDGSFHGEECFLCKPNHGLFVRPSMLKQLTGISSAQGGAG